MSEDPTAETTPTRRDASADSSSLLSSTAVMAAGTIVSRLSGFVRGILLAAALGVGLHADVFNIANTVPNMLYILLAGGVVNAVLVPQLVRAMRNDEDRGDAYTNRIITLAALFLGVVTILLVVAAPLLMRLFLDPAYFTPALAEQRESIIDFARYCLPQVFFYGMFVLVGQVLNAHGRFGPMMWAPIANNVVSVAVLTAYLITFGPASGAEKRGGFSSGAEALLGLGSTLGIVVQFAVLLPYLKAAGFRYRPRFDFRGSGLGHTLRLGVWTVLFVVVNQVAYTVVVRLASSGTVDGAGPDGTGYTIYSNSFLLTMVPHSIITVSLATAMLPLLSSYAAEGNLAAVGSLGLHHAPLGLRPRRAGRGVLRDDGARHGPRDLGLRQRGRRLRQLRPVAGALRARAGAVHRPLPGAARVLRPRADPAGVLDPVRHRGDQHRRGGPADPRGAGVGDRAPAGARLRLLLRGRRGHLLHPALAARSAGWPGAGSCASWCGS